MKHECKCGQLMVEIDPKFLKTLKLEALVNDITLRELVMKALKKRRYYK